MSDEPNLVLSAQRVAFDIRGLAEGGEPYNGVEIEGANLLDKCAEEIDRLARALTEARERAAEDVAALQRTNGALANRNTELAVRLNELERERDEARADAVKWERGNDLTARLWTNLYQERVEELTCQVEQWKSLASQIRTDWMPANIRLAAELTEANEEIARLTRALNEIVALDVAPFEMPSDWREQIDACSECQGWAKHHPIQRGICDTHRRPLWAREKHEENEVRAIGGRARNIARSALTTTEEKA